MKHKLDYLSIYLKIAPRRVSPFLRAEQTAVSISVENKTIEVEQECSTSGISGVVWDCGLLMVDILDSVLHMDCCWLEKLYCGVDFSHLPRL